ncbi:hypothetical protein [Tenacibaculum finnmarkense]|uniref:hypothetical protein n=1 Tax=Tenacibaculum finnmarkense TaxID=2781243 RepID=UPI001E2C6BE3|nr:hypothetical protein [Tenacibaculum finnmarkense]MCD8413438.1 hypothetical protein [Tenacibaculum finnmarkense genomovar ulcerans]MCG8207433.1 hypothetical protein [Tenacibaculum finnmarkense genomovar finnmarkense]MCG8723544.1 hypothetical protein [Tenacibaculum finnmarkense]MCG8741771.1 hypothetical protein [Tenacibaculum finnmarkense]MCG8765208.1 hypothetical protein [Tenacibaculum finnmarkense]
MNQIKNLILILTSFISYSQTNSIVILDHISKKELIGIQILSKEGSLLLSSDDKGNIDIKKLKRANIKNIVIYDSEYKIIEYKIDQIPAIIYLEKQNPFILNEITIKSKKKKKKYFKISGYLRSWQLVNNKLVRYGDALVDFRIPYKKSKNPLITGIKKKITAYRTFKTDTINPKKSIISFSGYNPFFDVNIPQENILIRQSYENYILEKKEDSLYTILKQGEKVGHLTYNLQQKPIKINLSENFEGKEAIKNAFGEFFAGSINIEKWNNKDKKRHLLYSFSNDKKVFKTKISNQTTETINEFFIDNQSIHSIKNRKISNKYRRNINKYKSYYNNEFWIKEIKKHPLPTNIKNQLTNINENKNIY